jgi:hypothetical protein
MSFRMAADRDLPLWLSFTKRDLFRSKLHNLFYMIRMLRSPLPRTIEYLPALVRGRGLTTVTWSEVSAKTRAAGFDVILATIGSESSGKNMRPGQIQSDLKIVVVYAQAAIEEAEFANIR